MIIFFEPLYGSVEQFAVGRGEIWSSLPQTMSVGTCD